MSIFFFFFEYKPTFSHFTFIRYQFNSHRVNAGASAQFACLSLYSAEKNTAAKRLDINQAAVKRGTNTIPRQNLYRLSLYTFDRMTQEQIYNAIN